MSSNLNDCILDCMSFLSKSHQLSILCKNFSCRLYFWFRNHCWRAHRSYYFYFYLIFRNIPRNYRFKTNFDLALSIFHLRNFCGSKILQNHFTVVCFRPLSVFGAQLFMELSIKDLGFLCLRISNNSFKFENSHIRWISKHTSSSDYTSHGQNSKIEFRKYLNSKV